jgi:predicted regulator of Ras-like GTPase activity (Roadblock/LC7/MglB family)
MQTLLTHLNAVPGVVGSLVCGSDGQLLAHAFPPVFDEALLADVAKTVAESAAGLATLTGPVKMLDLRHSKARIVVRPAAGATLLFLCNPAMNVQPLEISVSVAVPKLEKLVARRSAGAAAPDAPAAARAAPPPGKLFALVQRIEAAIGRKKLDPFATRGEIAMKAGFGLGFIDADTPDDAEKLSKLRSAASAVLGEAV